MKPKKLPRSVKAFLAIFGIYIGICLGAGTVIVVGALKGFLIGVFTAIIEVLGSLLICFALAWIYKKTLEEWGILSKEKENNEK